MNLKLLTLIAFVALGYDSIMLLTYQYRLQPTLLQGATLNHWGKLLRRTRSQFDRCSLTSEPIGDIPNNKDYFLSTRRFILTANNRMEWGWINPGRGGQFLIKLVREEVSLDFRNRGIFVLSPFLELIAQGLGCT